MQLLRCSAVNPLRWLYWVVLLIALIAYIWWSSRWSTRTKVMRRILFYVVVLLYIILHVATRKHEPLLYAIFAAAGVYALAQLVEDIALLRKSNDEG